MTERDAQVYTDLKGSLQAARTIAYVFVVQLESFAVSHWPRYKTYKQTQREGETEKKGTDAGSYKNDKDGDFLHTCSNP